jgi:hypothetical protein
VCSSEKAPAETGALLWTLGASVVKIATFRTDLKCDCGSVRRIAIILSYNPVRRIISR